MAIMKPPEFYNTTADDFMAQVVDISYAEVPHPN